jgi:hypothetical protein
MSDWIDLQLAHSLNRVKAPEALWSRLQAAQAGVVETRPRWRWAAPFAIAVCVLLMLLVVRASALELRGARTEFVSNDPVAMERWLAHHRGSVSRRGQAPAVRVKSEMASARVECVACHRG